MMTYDDLIEAGISEREKFIQKETEIIEYCLPYVQTMWAAKIISIILDCDFKDSEPRGREYLISIGKHGT